MNQPPTRLEFDAITAAQAERDLTTALDRVREHREQHPDPGPIECRIVLDLTPAQPRES
ncbi:hypothetical protein ABZ383_30490 [Streptomyces sp. NPDC005900]|uniref:hypothetical protein n=1 Tax=Streptomyces sp. NPDC005900 TaxID=3154569 RepID=UPI0033D1C5AD